MYAFDVTWPQTRNDLSCPFTCHSSQDTNSYNWTCSSLTTESVYVTLLWKVSQQKYRNITNNKKNNNLACSANLPEGLYILPALISFFLSSFLMIARRTILSGSAGQILCNLFTKWKHDARSGLLFPISQGRLPWQPILWKNGKLPLVVALAFWNRMGYRYLSVPINSVNDASISFKNFVNFG